MSTVAPPVRKQKPRKAGPGSGAGPAVARHRQERRPQHLRRGRVRPRAHHPGRQLRARDRDGQPHPLEREGGRLDGRARAGRALLGAARRLRPHDGAALAGGLSRWPRSIPGSSRPTPSGPSRSSSPPSTTPSSCARSNGAARRRRPGGASASRTGLALIAIGLLSPLEHIALTSLLSAHLLQNVILADWAPPLLVLGLTPAMMAAAERRAWVRAVTAPPVALALWLAAWYVLHVPAVYGYALEHRWALGLEHLAFLGSGLAFWWAVMSPGRMRAQARAALPLRRVHRRRAGRRSPSPSPSRSTTSTSTRRSSGGSRRSRISRSARSGWRSSRPSSSSPHARSRSCSGWTRMRPRAGR